MKIKLISIALIACLAVVAIACGQTDGEKGESASGGFFEPEKEVSELSIVCVGDIMAHKPQYETAYDSATGTYNFDENYKYVKQYIEEADLALCNVETVFADKTPSGYPLFNAPDELANAIKEAGFDVAFTANNHMLDQGTSGAERTIKVLRNEGLVAVGSRLTEEEPEYSIVEAEGIKVGFVAYTFETTGSNSRTSINGNPVPSDIENRICSFNPDAWETDITDVEQNVKAAKSAGADIVICYFHWGSEYQSQPSEYQVNMATQLIADTGVDVIFASHPHVIEPAVVLWNDKWQKNVPVYYSMGNFISNQRSETLGAGKRNTEDGMIAGVKFEITKTDGELTKIEMVQANVLPTWVNRYSSGGWKYEIIPLDALYEDNQSLAASGNVSKANKSITDSLNVLGTNYEKDSAGRILLFDSKQWADNSKSE